MYRLIKSSNFYYQIFYPFQDQTGGYLYNVAISSIDGKQIFIQKSVLMENKESNLSEGEVKSDEKLQEIDSLFKAIYANKLGFTREA